MHVNVFKFKPFSKKQRQVLNWWCNDSPARDFDGIICDGAIRSGKTISMSLSFVIWAMATFDGQNLGMCGKTIGSLRRNVIGTLKQMLVSRGYSISDRRADNLLIITHGNVRNDFYLFGGKDERSQDLVQGITLAGCFFDEVALMPESFVNQATGRCSVTGSKFWFNCNPDGPYHWFKTDWIDIRDVKNMLHLHFTMDDNESLSEHVKDRYKSMYHGVFYKRYIKGEWCMAEGLIYDMFDEEKHVKNITEIAPNLIGSGSYISVDYGTQNATVALLWSRGKHGKWYCMREYYYSGRDKGRQKTDSEYVADLLHWMEGMSPQAVIVDPSAASFIAELRKNGFRVLKAKNDVLDGIRTTSTILASEGIYFCDQCVNTIGEFGSYVWDEKASAMGDDRPIKTHDHAMDAMRYFVYTVLSGGARLRDNPIRM